MDDIWVPSSKEAMSPHWTWALEQQLLMVGFGGPFIPLCQFQSPGRLWWKSLTVQCLFLLDKHSVMWLNKVTGVPTHHSFQKAVKFLWVVSQGSPVQNYWKMVLGR